LYQLHGGQSNRGAKNDFFASPSTPNSRGFVDDSFSPTSSSSPMSLLSSLKIDPRESFEPVHPILLRKYIGYARKYVHPVYVSLFRTKLSDSVDDNINIFDLQPQLWCMLHFAKFLFVFTRETPKW
jgi:hypothetical protein